MPKLSTAELTRKANLIRQDIIRMLLKAGSGHSAGPMGMGDIFPARYAAMAHAGYFPREWLWKLRKLDSPLQGHPERARLPGVETTSGPLGSGLAQSSGVAYAARR